MIRGGNYCNVTFSNSQKKNIKNEEKYSKELPLCKCNLPCDISYNQEKKSIYFYCAKKNFYNKLYDVVEIDDSDPCNFIQRYEKYDSIFDKYVKETNARNKEESWNHLVEMIGSFS
jgi:hypothetical protein